MAVLELGELGIANLGLDGEDNPEDILHGTAYLFGMPIHVRFFRVKELEMEVGDLQLWPCDPRCELENSCLYALSGADGPLMTCKVPGYEGDYIFCAYPHTR